MSDVFTSYLEDDQRDLKFQVLGIGGPLCSVSIAADAQVAELKSAIETQTGIPLRTQRLFHGLVELVDEADFTNLPDNAGAGLSVDADQLLLVQRTEEQAEWLRRAKETILMPAHWLRDAPEVIQADREVVLATVAKCQHALEHAALELRADRTFMLAAVAKNGHALAYAAPELQADVDVVMAAVTQTGFALEFAARELRSDYKVVLAAVKRHGGALRFAARELRHDPELALASEIQVYSRTDSSPASSVQILGIPSWCRF